MQLGQGNRVAAQDVERHFRFDRVDLARGGAGSTALRQLRIGEPVGAIAFALRYRVFSRHDAHQIVVIRRMLFLLSIFLAKYRENPHVVLASLPWLSTSRYAAARIHLHPWLR
ncbi:hypothetical protein ACFQAT_02670 [Undibacterium arcticum]|uniref:hypothetical protein n=1 Tax=Undibacterium arcticum TaxID=1762892 RepID=UPI00361DCCFB